MKTITIIDWDDSLLCTSYLAQVLTVPCVGGSIEIPRDVRVALQRLAKSVCGLLSATLQVGQVCILTNSLSGWVDFSQTLLPGVPELLKHCHIFSARSAFGEHFPQEQWKKLAMLFLLSDPTSPLLPNGPCQVISIGDSQMERNAVSCVESTLSHVARVKSVLLETRPSPAQLASQLDCLRGCFPNLVSAAQSLDLSLARTAPARTTSPSFQSVSSPSTPTSASCTASQQCSASHPVPLGLQSVNPAPTPCF